MLTSKKFLVTKLVTLIFLHQTPVPVVAVLILWKSLGKTQAQEIIETDLTLSSDYSFSTDLVVGDTSSGTITILDSADVTINGETHIGGTSDGNGSINISGPGSSYDTGTNETHIGEHGSGLLDISGGALFSSSSIDIAYHSDSSGTVTVRGSDSEFASEHYLVVGRYGDGTMNLLDGATATSSTGYIGEAVSGLGAVAISGENSLWINDGSTFVVGLRGQGSLRLSEGGRLALIGGSRALEIAREAGSSGTLSIGALSGESAIAAGQLSAATVNFGSGDGQILFNHTDPSYQFEQDVYGTGDLRFENGGTKILGDYSGFSGDATVSGGSMFVNTSFLQPISILADATLGGNGTVGPVSLSSGATIAPGDGPDAIGTLSVDGAFTFSNGTEYKVDLASDGTADRLAATGVVTIEEGSSVSLSAHDGDADGSALGSGTTYEIVSSSELRGSFDEVNEDFAYLDAKIEYTDDTATVRLHRAEANSGDSGSSGDGNGGSSSEDGNTIRFADLAENANQFATANAIESAASGKLYSAIESLPAGSPPEAFQQLSGEFHATLHGRILEGGRRSRDIMGNRLRLAAARSAPLYYDDPQQTTAAPPPLRASNDLNVWGQTFGGWGEAGKTANTVSVTQKSAGLFLGADTAMIEGWHTGALLGYSRDWSRAQGNTASAQTNNFTVGAYAGRPIGPVGLQVGAANTWHDISTTRSVAFPGFKDQLNAGYGGQTTQAFGELTYLREFKYGGLEPYLNAALVRTHVGAFAEKGGAAALSAKASNLTTGAQTLGVRGKLPLMRNGDLTASVYGDLAWRHTYGDITPNRTMRFSGAGRSFEISGAPISRETAVIAGGLKLDIGKRGGLNLSYGGEFGRNSANNTGQATFSIKF